MGKGKKREKFKFGTDFQLLILQFIATDPKAFKVIPLVEDHYFELIPHAIVALTIKKYYKKHHNIPEESYLREFLRTQYELDRRTFHDLTPQDKDAINDTITHIYTNKVKHPDQILDKIIKFAQYVRFKDELEQVDINNFDSWEASITKLKKATSVGSEIQENNGVFLIRGINDRAHKRDITNIVTPTPFRQFNSLLNSGGTQKGNVITILSKEKIGKTVMMINVARGYLKMRKMGIYVDLENGVASITTRSEQSASNQSQETIQSGDYDDKLMKLFRKYRRIGAELAIQRFPSLKTTMDNVQIWLDRIKLENPDFDPRFAIIDYGVLLGAISGKQDDYNRISDAFLDIKNFAEANNFDVIWTAAHTTRQGDRRLATKFESTDIAKCNDIPRHVDCVLGLQQSPQELEGGVWRLEVIEQRNGMAQGKMLFWVDIAKQRMKEFTKGEVKRYMDKFKDQDDDEDDEDPVEKKKKRKAKSDL